MAYDLLPRNMFQLPMVTMPSLLDDFEDLMPTSNVLSGLSVSEDEKNIYIEAAVPGIDPKNVEVTYAKGMLTIKADKQEEEKGKRYHRKATQSFFYRTSPGNDVNQSIEPQAICKNGIMTVTFSKIPEAKPKRIAVKSS